MSPYQKSFNIVEALFTYNPVSYTAKLIYEFNLTSSFTDKKIVLVSSIILGTAVVCFGHFANLPPIASLPVSYRMSAIFVSQILTIPLITVIYKLNQEILKCLSSFKSLS